MDFLENNYCAVMYGTILYGICMIGKQDGAIMSLVLAT